MAKPARSTSGFTRPGGHPNLSAPLEPHPLIKQGIGLEQQCLEVATNIDGQVQSSRVMHRQAVET